jgi:lysophospholipase L1-like esterase
MAQDFLWQDGDRVMFLGDAASDDPQGYVRLIPEMVAARYPERRIVFQSRGMGGNRVGDMLARLDRDVLTGIEQPTWIVLSVGINDVFHGAAGTPLGRFVDAYAALLQRLRSETGARLLVLTTTPIGEELDNAQNAALTGYNDAIAAIGFQYGAQVVHVNQVFQESMHRAQATGAGIRFTVDNVHLTPVGHYLLALTLLGALYFALPMAKPGGGLARAA